MMVNLKVCPVCGSKQVIVRDDIGWHYECENENCQWSSKTEKTVLDKWMNEVMEQMER